MNIAAHSYSAIGEYLKLSLLLIKVNIDSPVPISVGKNQITLAIHEVNQAQPLVRLHKHQF